MKNRSAAGNSGVVRLVVALFLVCSVAVAAKKSAEGEIPLATQSTQSDALNTENHKWFTSWGAPHGVRIEASSPLSGQSVRMIVRPSTSGNRLRVKLENTMGEDNVVFSEVFVGVADSGASLVAGTNVQLAFGGNPEVTLLPGAGVYSDFVDFTVEAFERLAVSINVAYATDISVHRTGLAKNYIALGALAANAAGDGFVPIPDAPGVPAGQGNIPFYWVAGLDVRTPHPVDGTIVVFGDSIAAGVCSTKIETGFAPDDLYQRWIDVLAERLALLPNDEDKETNPKAVANGSIAGNALMTRITGPSGLERLDRDVLDRAGISHVILALGSNDIASLQSTDEQVIAGMQQVIDRVHSAGVKIIGATIIPRPAGAWSEEKERRRLAVNAWIRGADFDGVIDFAELMKGPLVRVRDGSFADDIKAGFNCGDNIHPNPAGYHAMGEFVDLSLFTSPGKVNEHNGDNSQSHGTGGLRRR